MRWVGGSGGAGGDAEAWVAPAENLNRASTAGMMGIKFAEQIWDGGGGGGGCWAGVEAA